MTNFETPHLQRMRNAGLAVYSEKVADVDGEGNGGIRITVIDGDHKLWLFGAKDKWVAKSCLANASDAPCAFEMHFDTRDEVVASAIEYFQKDHRWRAVQEHLERQRKTSPQI